MLQEYPLIDSDSQNSVHKTFKRAILVIALLIHEKIDDLTAASPEIIAAQNNGAQDLQQAQPDTVSSPEKSGEFMDLWKMPKDAEIKLGTKNTIEIEDQKTKKPKNIIIYHAEDGKSLFIDGIEVKMKVLLFNVITQRVFITSLENGDAVVVTEGKAVNISDSSKLTKMQLQGYCQQVLRGEVPEFTTEGGYACKMIRVHQQKAELESALPGSDE